MPSSRAFMHAGRCSCARRGSRFRQLRQFVSNARGEQRPASDLIVQVFRDAPRQGDAVVSAGAATDLIKNDQAARRGVIKEYSRPHVISTMNVLCARLSSSLAPTRVKMRSASPTIALFAGTKLPICAISVNNAA